MAKEVESLVVVAPPKPSDYLPASIKKAVLGAGLKHPVTLYPVAGGLSLGFVGWLFQMPFLYKIGLAGLVLGPLWALISVVFFHQKIGSGYINIMNRRQKEYEQYIKKLIKKGLQECRSIEGASKYADQGVKQFDDIREKYNNVKELLELKLKSTELTFGRFLGAAEQVSLSALDNLKSVINTIKSAGSIHPVYIKKQIDELSKGDKQTKEDLDQIKTLESRLELYKNQFIKVRRLLAKNEEAMTEMEKISAAVADWNTDGRFAGTDFESAIARLHELAEQAHIYNTDE